MKDFAGPTATQVAGSQPGISVIVPHYNQLDSLRACLQALTSQSQPADEIIVVDNGSDCGLEAVRRCTRQINPAIMVLEAASRGAAHARNVGVAASAFPLIAFADGDVRPDVDWLLRGVAALEDHPIVGGRVDVFAGRSAEPNAVEAWDVIFGFNAAKIFRRSKHLLTGNLFLRRNVLLSVGGFRHGVPEDFEWCRRAASAGYPLHYEDTLVVMHPALHTWSALKARHIRLAREAFTWSKEQPGGRLVFWIRSWLALASIAPHGVRILFARTNRMVPKGGVLWILARIRTVRFVRSQALVFGLCNAK